MTTTLTWQDEATGSFTNMPSAGAFHRVDAKRSFQVQLANGSSSQTSTQSDPPPPQPKKLNWPEPVRRYVQRAFMPEHSIAGIERSEMERKLKETITQANEKNTLDTTDWDSLPLPQQLIQNERTTSAIHGYGVLSSAMPWHASASKDLTIGGFPPQTKKRKSSDLQYDSSADDPTTTQNTVPWRKTNKRNLNLEDRVTFPSKASDPSVYSSPSSKYQKYQNGNLEKRQKRFETGMSNLSVSPHPWSVGRSNASPPPEANQGPVIGTCQVLEKKYFRLTAAPNPSTVRPLPVLQKTLELLKKKWRADNNYGYICDQFKSLRQDLTVQHIKTEFTVIVYETHARIALEKGDLGEYNQCQTQLRALYSHKLGGHAMEFKAYRILYFIHTCNRTDMNDVLANLTPAEKKEEAVRHALDVRSALALGNYHQFFRLYLETPNMGAYLMDMFVVRERLAALATICRAYKPALPLRFITEELAFESDGQCLDFIINDVLGGDMQLIEDRGEGDQTDIWFLAGKAGALFETAKREACGRVDIKGQI